MKIEGFFLVLLLVLFQGCSDVKQSKEYVKVVSDRDSLAEMLEKREKEVEDFAKEFDQIEQNLTAIDTNKARLILINSRGKTSQKERIHNLIADIYIALDKNQTLIKGLEKRAMFSNETTALKSIVKTLRNTLEAKATEIQILEKQLSNLELEVKKWLFSYPALFDLFKHLILLCLLIIMPFKSFIVIFSISLNNADSLPLSPIVIIFDFSLIIGVDSLFLLFQSNQVRQNLLYFQGIPLNF
jgi:hypothetical protein